MTNHSTIVTQPLQCKIHSTGFNFNDCNREPILQAAQGRQIGKVIVATGGLYLSN